MGRRPVVVVCGVVLAAGLLAACSGGAQDASGALVSVESVAPDGPFADPDVGADLGTGTEDAADAGAGPAGAAADADRQVVTTASAELTVADPARGAQQVSELVESVGGRVEQRSVLSAPVGVGPPRAVADLVVRVPADELTGVLADLADLGEVQGVSVSRSDRTAAAVDLDARIGALQTSADRLQDLLAGAATTEALLAAEEALADRQAELDALRSSRALLADQVELATLEVQLTLPVEQPDGDGGGGPEGFLGGLVAGWGSLTAAVGVGAVVLGVVLPWLLAGAALVGVVVLVSRGVGRRVVRRGAATPDDDPDDHPDADPEAAPGPVPADARAGPPEG